MPLLKEEESYKIIGMCMEVHRELGPGFSEVVYKDALEIEAELAGIPLSREKPFRIHYKTQLIKRIYYADFVFFDDIIIEAKAQRSGFSSEDENQLLNYLKASGCKVGYLVNFGMKSLQYKRMVW